MAVKKPKRLVEHLRTDPFVDMAFVQPLLEEEEWLEVLRRQASIYISTGDMGKDTRTFSVYRNAAGSLAAEALGSVYRKTVSKGLPEKLVHEKAERAWEALLMFLASTNLLKEIGLGLGESLPWRLPDPRTSAPVIRKILATKTGSAGGTATTSAVRKAVKELEGGAEKLLEVAPLLWWINIYMEREVFEGVFKFHYLMYSRKREFESFAEGVEKALAEEIAGHEGDAEYMKYELSKALLSRCAELRGQYINKLQNALLFVKLLRWSEPKPERWEWFLNDDVLTYVAAVYITEIQRLAWLAEHRDAREGGRIPVRLRISDMVGPKKGPLAGEASALASFILLSPIFMQYAVETGRAGEDMPATPADIAVAVLRLINKQEKRGDFVVDVREVAEEILEFWREADILRRLEKYSGKPLASAYASSQLAMFNASLSFMIRARIRGVQTSVMEKPLLRLPPRGEGYDSLFILPRQFLSIVKKIWESGGETYGGGSRDA